MEFIEDISAWQKRVGTRVAAIRRAHGLSRAAFGARLGITAGMVGKIERGQSLLMPAHAVRIRQVFEISLDALYEQSEHGPEEVEVLTLIHRLSIEARKKLRQILHILIQSSNPAAPEKPPPHGGC